MRESRSNARAGFTLVEVLVAVFITTIVITIVLQTYTITLESRDEVRALGEPMTTGPRILDMIEDDVAAIWTYNIKDGRVLLGESRDIAGYESDRLHFIVGGETVFPVRQADDTQRPASVAEVSYMVKANPQNPELFELWRREDPLVDDQMKVGGGYLLLTNRLRGKEGFRITYFEEIGKDAEALNDWDSAERGRLPRRIRIEFAIERSGATHGALEGGEVEQLGGRVLRYHRDIVLSQDQVLALTPGVALVPVVPKAHPELESAQAGGGGAAAAQGGGGGRGGADAGRGNAGDATVRGRNTTQTRGQGQPVPRLPGGGQTPPNIGDLIRNLPRGGGTGGSGGNRGGGGGR